MAENQKLTIEKRQYEIFCAKFDKGEFGTQRFGQAFYDYFKLFRMVNQSALNNIYAKDGNHAKNSIQQIFEFT